MTFADFEFEYELQDSLDAMRFETPTPVQEQTIPVIMKGSDIIACAQTGTGKTAAYLLPTINRIVREPQKGIDTVVLVPTRELALQIDQQMEGFGYYVQVSSVAVYGGNDSAEWNRQKNAIVEGADILIATPGRLLQHISMGYVDFSSIRCLILDEADRMLDMGFYDDIMQVVKQMPVEGRQTLMFSATMPPKIREMAKAILHEPAEVNIAISKPAEGVKQGAYVVYDPQKAAVIRHILEGRKEQSIIVFSTRKQTVKELARELRRTGYNADVIHSDLEQKEREEALLKFRNRQTNILVATDIIARGIDIEKIDVVINYEVPHDAEDYVHRVGRTARAQTQGEAYTLVSESDMYAFGQIEQLIEMTVEKLPLPEEIGEGPAYEPNKRMRGPRGGNNRQQRNGHNDRRQGRQGQNNHGNHQNNVTNQENQGDNQENGQNGQRRRNDGNNRRRRPNNQNNANVSQSQNVQPQVEQPLQQVEGQPSQNVDSLNGQETPQHGVRRRNRPQHQRRRNHDQGQGSQFNFEMPKGDAPQQQPQQPGQQRRPRPQKSYADGENVKFDNGNNVNNGERRRRYNDNRRRDGRRFEGRGPRRDSDNQQTKPQQTSASEQKSGLFGKVKSAIKSLFGRKD